MENEVVLEGAIAVTAVLEAESRPVSRVLLDKRIRFERDAAKIRKLAERTGAVVEITDADGIAALAQGTSHGGVIAVAGERRFVEMDDLVMGEATDAPESRPYNDSSLQPFIVMLDGIEDPFNFGQAVRAFYAAGADGLVLRPRNWMSAAGVVARSSAGASERILTAVAETVEDAAAFLRGRGLQVAVAAKERAVPLYEADLTDGLFLVVGGEKRGVTRSFADGADIRISIPYGRAFPHSLGTVAAASTIAFEVLRQRRK